jgi:hypothetical protein
VLTGQLEAPIIVPHAQQKVKLGGGRKIFREKREEMVFDPFPNLFHCIKFRCNTLSESDAWLLVMPAVLLMVDFHWLITLCSYFFVIEKLFLGIKCYSVS